MKSVALGLIRLYQRTLSPVQPARCRFVPTCSQYTYEAIAHYGILGGGLRAAWRLVRCHPLSRGGYDPVPGTGQRKPEVKLSRLKKRARYLLVAIPLLGLLLTACMPRSQGGSAITLEGDTIYAASPQGKVLSLNAEQRRRGLPFPGAGEWVSPPEKGFGIIYAQPLPSGDNVFVATFDGKVRVLNRATGALRDEAPLFPAEKQSNNPSLVATPTLTGKTLLIAVGNELHAIDTNTGLPRWKNPFRAGNRIWASPVLLGDRVIVASLDRRLYAVSLATGERVWSFESGGGLAATPLIVGNTIYAGSFDGYLYALGSDGRPVWPSPFPVGKWVWSRPFYHEGTVYFGALDGVFYAVNATTGAKRWSLDTEEAIRAAPVMADGLLAVANTAGEVYSLYPGNGSVQWQRSLGEGITVSTDLVAYGGEVLVTSDGGTLYALEAKTGKVAWSRSLTETVK